MKATEQHFSVVLLRMLRKVVLTFHPVDESLKCDHSSVSNRTVLSCGTVYNAMQGGSIFL